MLKRILAPVLAVLALLGGGAAVWSATANAQGGPAILCAHTGDRALTVFDTTCPAGFFPAQLPASAVVGGTAGTGVQGPAGAQGPKGDTGPAGAQGPAGRDGVLCASGYTVKDVIVDNKAKTAATAADLKDAQAVLAKAKVATAAANLAVVTAQAGSDRAVLAAATAALKAAQENEAKAQAAVDKLTVELAVPATLTISTCVKAAVVAS